MRRTILILLLITLAGSCTPGEVPVAGKRVLIYTRNGAGYVHDNIAASVAALEEICAGLGIETVVTDSPAVFTPAGLEEFDAVIFSNSNNDAFTSEAQREAFQAFIRSGKGFAGIHSSSGSERNWPWFQAMQGGLFLRHPPLQPFDIHVIDGGHISTAHLPGVWAWEDECYYLHYLNPDIHVLLAADLSTVEDAGREEYPGTTFGDHFPLSWCHRFEGGRQWYTALGHQIAHYDDPLFRDHLKGGILWVLGRE
jgi:type 1 glutamine amidotransferase